MDLSEIGKGLRGHSQAEKYQKMKKGIKNLTEVLGISIDLPLEEKEKKDKQERIND